MKNVLLAIIIVMSLVSGACHKAQPPAAPTYETVTINVQNPNGSYTPVTLTKLGGEFIGPKGEHYLSMPTEDKLAQLYGVTK